MNTASKKYKQKKVGLLHYTLRVITLYHLGMGLSTHFVEFRLTFFTPRVMVTLRRGAGMTQAELAKKLGISKSSVSMYECGNREPEFDLLEKMADLLRVDMNVLLGRGEPLVNNDPELTAYLEALRDRPEMRALFRLSQNATREDVETAVTILEALRSKHEDT